jgi:hypothetical protein
MWSGGTVVIVWARRTRAPLRVVSMLDAKPPEPAPPPGAAPPVYVDAVGPAPLEMTSLESESDDARDLKLLLGRMIQPAISAGPPVAPVPELPALDPGRPQALPYHYHLPSYARPREPLPAQRNVSVRGGIVAGASETAPPPGTPGAPVRVGGHGLLAGAEVRAYHGPLPPSSLEPTGSVRSELGAVPVTPPSVTPVQPLDIAAEQPRRSNTAQTMVAPVDALGHTETAPTAPPRPSAPLPASPA